MTQHPEWASLFRPITPDRPPLGCDQMVYTIVCLLKDNADEAPYVEPYLQDLLVEHTGFGVDQARSYVDVLDVVQAVVAGRLEGFWPPAESSAWARQTAALQAKILSLAPVNATGNLRPPAA